MSAAQKPARPGQIWRDTFNYGQGSPLTKSPPTLLVTKTDGQPGGFAHGIRQPSGRRTRVRLDMHGGLCRYVLVKDAPEEAATVPPAKAEGGGAR